MSDLEVVLLGLASHDDVESLVGVLGTSLDAVGHVLLVLIRIQPHAECSGVTSQFGLRIRTLSQTQRRFIDWTLYGPVVPIYARCTSHSKVGPPPLQL